MARKLFALRHSAQLARLVFVLQATAAAASIEAVCVCVCASYLEHNIQQRAREAALVR